MDSKGSNFQEQVARLAKEGSLAITNAVRCANNLPKGNTWQSYNAYEAFQLIANKTSKTVLNFANAILAAEGISNTLSRFNNPQQEENLVIANDNFLETIKFNIDVFEGRKEIAAMHSRKKKRRRYRDLPDTLVNLRTVLSNDITPKPAKLQNGVQIALKKPQLDFTTPINNDNNTVFRPKLLCKPNSSDPNWALEEYEYKGLMLINHPYESEIDAWKPADYLVKFPPPPFSQPPGLENTKYTYIDTKEGVDELVQHLNTVKAIAVDVENHSLRCYQGLTCLIQITTDEGGDFIIDAIKLRDDLQGLNEPFTNGNIIKVFHGAAWDMEWLQRDHNVYVVGLFDTYEAAQLLHQRPAALKNLMQKYVGILMDKTHQLSDWRVRPLPEDMIKYARMDTHYLLYIWRCMWRELYREKNNNTYNVYSKSAIISKRTYIKPITDKESWYNCYRRIPKINFNDNQRKCFRLLYEWRDSLARKEDDSASYLIPNRILAEVAKQVPRDKKTLLRLLTEDFVLPLCVRHRLENILAIINSYCKDESENEKKKLFEMLIPNDKIGEKHLGNIDTTEIKQCSSDIESKLSISLKTKPISGAIEAYNLVSSTSYSTPLPNEAFEFIPPYKRLLLTAEYYDQDEKKPS